jgi:hypothetical protein
MSHAPVTDIEEGNEKLKEGNPLNNLDPMIERKVEVDPATE